MRGGKEIEGGQGEEEILEAIRVLCTYSNEPLQGIKADHFQVSERQWATGRYYLLANDTVG